PRLLDVRGAVEKLPALPLPDGTTSALLPQSRMTGTDDRAGCGPDALAPGLAPTRYNRGHSGAIAGTEGSSNGLENRSGQAVRSACSVNEKPPMASAVTGGHRVGLTGFEPATSWSRSQLPRLMRTSRKQQRGATYTTRLPLTRGPFR